MEFPSFTILVAAAGVAAGALLCWLLMRSRSAVSIAPQASSDVQGELTQARGRIRKLEEDWKAAVKNHDDLKHQTARSREQPDLRTKDTAPPPELTAQLTSLQAQLTALQAQEIAARADAAKARSDALAEQVQAKEYFQLLEKNQQLAAASAQTIKLDADKLHATLEQSRKDHAQALQQAAQIPELEARLMDLQNKEHLNQQAAQRGAQSHEKSAELLVLSKSRVAMLEHENAVLKRSAAAVLVPASQTHSSTQLPVLEEQVVALQNLEKTIKKEFQLLAELQRNVTLTSATRHEFIDSPESRVGVSSSAAA